MSEIKIGDTLGGYTILEVIGQGGMATVYRAHQLSMDRDVAVKVLPPQFLNDTTSLDRFKQEASIVARLEHRAIVPVHDYGEYEGIPYIVMRYMDGGSVDDLLARGPVDPPRALQILDQIAPALDYAHREGVLHRDLKPSNILLDANGDAYLTDFGIARILGTKNRPLTTSGVVGTPSYMSPEQAQGHDLDGRSDVYALGVVLFEMLAGARPFEGETPYSVAVKHVTAAPPSPCAINPALPRAVETVLFKVLEKKRELRFHSAGELAAALRQAIQAPGERPVQPTLIETEPSLNEKLRVGVLQPPPEQPPLAPPPVYVPPVSDNRQRSPDIQVMAPYVPPPSRSYTGPLVPQRRQRTANGLPAWLTWVVAALLIGAVLLAVAVGGIYYLMNDTPVETLASVDYGATAVFKLTATRQAIVGTPTPDLRSATPDTPAVEPTAPPTNTLVPPPTSTSGATQ